MSLNGDARRHHSLAVRRVRDKVGGPPSLRGYVVGKLLLDPAFPTLLALVRERPGPLLDLGCGLGLLAFYLREHGYRAPIHGVDVSGPKIERAQRVAAEHYEGLTFAAAPMEQAPLGASTVALLDVVHYLPRGERSAFLDRIARSVPPGGLVLLRNTPRDASWRYRATFLEEIWVRASGWIRARGPIDFPTAEELISPFQAAGFTHDVQPLWGRTPFNSHLFTFRKPH